MSSPANSAATCGPLQHLQEAAQGYGSSQHILAFCLGPPHSISSTPVLQNQPALRSVSPTRSCAGCALRSELASIVAGFALLVGFGA